MEWDEKIAADRGLHRKTFAADAGTDQSAGSCRDCRMFLWIFPKGILVYEWH